MGIVGLALGLVLSVLGSGPDEHVLITGRIQLTGKLVQNKTPESRRFEVTIARRAGVAVTAQACLFADLARDREWNGACFPLDLKRIAEALGEGHLKENALAPVDASAQRLLRLIAEESRSVMPERRVLGYDADREIDLYVSRFTEADL
jgi:hypothetical protein